MSNDHVPEHDALVARALEHVTLFAFIIPTAAMFNLLENRYPNVDLKPLSNVVGRVVNRLNTVFNFVQHVELYLQEPNFDL